MGITETKWLDFWQSVRTLSRISAGPVEQLIPTASSGRRSMVASAAETSVPSSMRPEASIRVGWAMRKTSRAASRRAASAPSTAARSSRMSCWVSMRMASAPPSMRARACSWKIFSSASPVMADSAGSDDDGSMPVGPIEPATKRGCPGAACRSAARRARMAARKFTS